MGAIFLTLQRVSCAGCVAKVERALQSVPNVEKARVNLAEQTAFVVGDNLDPEDLVQAVVNAGYGAQWIEDEESRLAKQQAQINAEIQQRKWQAGFALALGFGLMAWMFVGDMQVSAANQGYWIALGLLTLVVMFFSGGHFYRNALNHLRNKTATMDTLVALGTGAAWLFSMVVALFPNFFPDSARHLYFESSAMIIGFINLGKMLEIRAKSHSSQTLTRLLNLTPKTVILVEQEAERKIPLYEVCANMVLRLKTGDRVSVDGVVTQGEAWFDESALTGESLPVYKTLGDQVSSGTLVTDGSILFRAEQVGKQTSLAKIIQLVRQAQSSKPQIGQLADKISAVFVPIVIAIALLAAVIWYVLTQDIAYSVVVLTTVLIIACPCALGLATPMAIIASVGRAAELGILVRNGDALQNAANVDTIVLDKTGTITQGSPQVMAIYPFDCDEKQAIYWAASLEQNANHPLATAILELAPEKLASTQNFSTLKGLGVKAVINGKNIALGNRTLMDQMGVEIKAAETFAQKESEKGATTVFLAVENRLCALFAIRDTLRKDSYEALQRLRQQGYQLVMLTGDQEPTAQAIASETGIDQVIANVLPEDKAKAIQALQKQRGRVLMVGDGINDAPALAQADVSMAMGSGSDIAMETADLTLMRHSLHAVADALCLAKGTKHNIQQNLFFAFIYNCLGIPLAAGLFYPLFGVLLNPMIGGAAMALSSIMVVTNANRLLKFKPKF